MKPIAVVHANLSFSNLIIFNWIDCLDICLDEFIGATMHATRYKTLFIAISFPAFSFRLFLTRKSFRTKSDCHRMYGFSHPAEHVNKIK